MIYKEYQMEKLANFTDNAVFFDIYVSFITDMQFYNLTYADAKCDTN